MAFLARIGAWIYPGSPACNAQTEYQDGRVLYMLKPQYYQVDTGGAGTINQLTVAGAGCNAYSAANAADVRKYSTKQFFTISCGTAANMDALCSSGTNRTNAINTIITFLQLTQFTGVELDWEGYGSWTAGQYTNFKTFVSALSTSLHSNGFQLMIDGPPITNSGGVPVVDTANQQSLYKFKYEDFLTTADYLCVLAYDKQYDFGSGTSISPTTFVQNVCDWMISKVVDTTKIVVGMPSYGYHGVTAGFSITIDTQTQSSVLTGYGTATRNSDFEMNWANAGSSFFYQDTSGMNSKRNVIEAKGIKHISVWHLGGNQWFTGAEPTSPASITDVTSVNNLQTIAI